MTNALTIVKEFFQAWYYYWRGYIYARFKAASLTRELTKKTGEKTTVTVSVEREDKS